MESQLEHRRLWSALSDLFVDAKVDYGHVAEVAKQFSIEEVEFALFERVAPVCIGNMLSPIPPIWWYFDADQLVMDIESLVEKRAKQGLFAKCITKVKGRVIRIMSADTWRELKAEIERVKTNG